MFPLKACPFCGFQPDIDDDDCVYPVNRHRTVWNVVCYELAGGCGASVLANSRDGAIARWNTRAKNNYVT